MSTSTGWNILDVGDQGAPKLLVKYRFDNSGYEVQLTDLSHIWREKLSKDEVIQRASDVGSSIDPAQDDEQFKIFLSKIENALDHEDDTSMNLSSGDVDSGSLSLQLSAALPHPLPSLSWIIYLQLLPSTEVEAQLVTPLVVQASHLQHQIEQLVNQLHDKDRVISKICDRLETSGNDLTTVFPGVSNIKTSRKKGQREQLARHVKGLADFDEYAWRAQQAKLEDSDDMAAERMDQVLRDLPSVASGSKDAALHDKWWQHLGDEAPSKATRTNVSRPRGNARRSSTNGETKDADESMQDAEFQRQSTPPHLRNQSAPDEEDAHDVESAPVISSQTQPKADSRTGEVDDSTTDDEDDLDAAPRKPAPPQRQENPPLKELQKSASPSPRKLGTIGGRSPRAPTPLTRDTTPEDKPLSTKSRSKLGTIGGKGKLAVSAPSEPESETPSSRPPPKKSKMGVIGGKKAPVEKTSPPATMDDGVRTAETVHEEPSRRSRTPAKTASPAPRETSQERADRKRDQLKRELEEKAKVPAKKKRKF